MRNIFLLLIVCAYTNLCWAQECNFSSDFMGQITIDNFSTNYPGCKVLKGNFSISPAVENLNGLAQLEGIIGSIKIDASIAAKLINLNGLHNLEFVTGNLLIVGNPDLETLQGLAKLKTVGGNLIIRQNSKLTTLQGLQSLETVRWLSIESNIRLEDISDLKQLKKVSSIFRLENNNQLKSISGVNSLDTIGEDLIIDHRHRNLKTIDGLNGLRHIGGEMRLKEIPLETVSGFQSLHSIGTNLVIEDCEELKGISGFNQLYQVGNEFLLKNNEALETITGFNSLYKVGKGFYIVDHPKLTNLFSFVNLSKLGALEIDNNDNLTTLFQTPSIDSVGWVIISDNYNLIDLKGLEQVKDIAGGLSIVKNGSLESLDGLDNILTIQEHITLRECPNLKQIEALSQIENLGGSLSLAVPDSLESLEGLRNLTSINGRLHLDGIGMAKNLQSLKKLSSVNGDLWISGSQNLESLDGLENLKSINGKLIIAGNKVLESIDGIRNIRPSSIRVNAGRDVRITMNPKLGVCGIKNICTLLYSPNTEFYIEQNFIGCNSTEEIRCINNGLSGTVFFDFNKNGIQDSLEAGIPNVRLTIAPLDIVLLTNQEGGYYLETTEDVTYTIAISSSDAWSITTDLASYQILFERGATSNDSIDFGLFPLVIDHQGSMNISSYATRCNETTEFIIGYTNTGNFIESGRINLQLDSLTNLLSASSIPNNLTDGSLEWSFDSLYPYEYRIITLEIQMPDETNTGTSMTFKGQISYDSGPLDTEATCAFYYPEVLCSYDPNDIIASPPGETEAHYTSMGQTLQYTIRFQNTGNAPAIDVRILDTLSHHMDMSTFKVLNTSFPATTFIKDHALDFRFDNIRLPDSTANEPESHGFITYSIAPLTNLPNKTLVENTAHILFDFNPPIVTNTAFNTYFEPTVAIREVLGEEVSIFPNPVRTQLFVQSEKQTILSLELFNMLGQRVAYTTSSKIDMFGLSDGVYIIIVDTNAGKFSETVVLEKR